MSDRDRQLLIQAQEKLREQQEFIDSITAPIHEIATVQQVKPFSLVVQKGGNLAELDRPNGTDGLSVGDRVCLNSMTGQVERVSDYVDMGEAGLVEGLEGGLFEIRTERGPKFVKSSRVPNLKIGDRVVLDSTERTILAKVKPRESTHQYEAATHVCWDDIGGLRDAKAELKLAIEEPIRNAKVFQFFHKAPPKGFLLEGPPGNGKTLLAKAAATAIGSLHGNVRGGFIYVKGPEILSKWVGESEEIIRNLFVSAREHKKRSGAMSVIFIDESDAVLGNRSMRTAGNMEHTIVPMFLSEMDGLDEGSAIVMLATNRADMLDPAIIRPGRIDRKIHVRRPTTEDALEVFLIHMRKLPISATASRDQLVENAMKTLYSNTHNLYAIRHDGTETHFGLRDLASGAFIAGIVEQATSFAVQRNLGQKKLDGLSWADFERAFDRIRAEQIGLNHEVELKEFMEARNIQSDNIVPLR